MTERPILFSGPMVRAILEGRKTQTRRVMKSQPYSNAISMSGGELVCHNDYLPPSTMLMDVGRGKNSYTTSDVESDGFVYHCPYGAPGDMLWVRETWSKAKSCNVDHTFYRADGENQHGHQTTLSYFERENRWRPSIHMPRWASRITLKVTDVRVERLQEISNRDAMAEGIVQTWGDFGGNPPAWALAIYNQNGDAKGPHQYDNQTSARNFAALWSHINGAESWAANPWVWVVSFKRQS